MPQINQLSATDNPTGGDQLPLFSTGNGGARKLSLSALAAWIAGAMSDVSVQGFVKVPAVTFDNLPSPVTAGAGARAFVTDSSTATFNAVIAGGGVNSVPCFSDGTQWRVG
jgi:hypothetical protein